MSFSFPYLLLSGGPIAHSSPLREASRARVCKSKDSHGGGRGGEGGLLGLHHGDGVGVILRRGRVQASLMAEGGGDERHGERGRR